MAAKLISIGRRTARVVFSSALAMAMSALSCSLPARAAGPPPIYGPGTIQGFAQDTEGYPAVGALVVLTDSTQSMERTATVNRDGGFFFFGVPSGSYTIKLDAGSGSIARDFLFIQEPGAGMTITLRLQDTETSDSPEAGEFQIRRTNPIMMGQLALAATKSRQQ